MKVYIGLPRGFCAGVVRAIDVVELALEKHGSPVYVKHQIVHNPYVVNSLEEKGAITVEDVDLSAKRCVELGGKILVEPKRAGKQRSCVIQDPAGAVTALYGPDRPD